MKNGTARLLYLLMALLILLGSGGYAVATAQTPEASPVGSPEASPVAEDQHGIQIDDLDLSVDPGEDFYRFANGGWLDRTELPGDSPRYGVFDQLGDQVDAQLQEVVTDLEPNRTTDTGKVKIVYDQFTDEDGRNTSGIAPIQPILDRIAAIDSLETGLLYQQDFAQLDGVGLFSVYAGSSPEDATMNIGWLGGPSLSLPSQDYYLDDSEEGQAIRDAWIETTAQMLVLSGYDEAGATAAATAVMTFETGVAKAMTPDEARSDPNTYNNPRTLAELQELLPGVDWEAFLAKLGVRGIDSLTVDDIAYLEALNGLLTAAEPDLLRHLYATQLVWGNAAYLSLDIADLAFSFQGPVLQGVTERRPIEERGVSVVQDLFPDALGQAYVDESFSPEAKAEIEALVDNIIASFRVRIEQSAWMSDATKAKALEKLDLLSVKVGYPDTWKDYRAVSVGNTLYASVYSASRLALEQNLAKIGTPVDRDEWGIGAFVVNAYYNPSLNEIVFPAAILQAPFFDPEADAASNYGAIGFVIGHEITHGFDISGSQFDGEGNLSSWWTDEDRAAFEALNGQVVDQYSAIEVLPGLNVDGELTVGENVADLGGLQTAYDAMLIALGDQAQGDQPWFLTQQQRFFVAASQTWRSKTTEEFTQYLISVDVHAPSEVRSVQPLRNMDMYYEAFDIDEGDPEYLPEEERILVW